MSDGDALFDRFLAICREHEASKTPVQKQVEALQKLRAAQDRVAEARQDELVALAEFMAADKAARAAVAEVYFKEEVRP